MIVLLALARTRTHNTANFEKPTTQTPCGYISSSRSKITKTHRGQLSRTPSLPGPGCTTAMPLRVHLGLVFERLKLCRDMEFACCETHMAYALQSIDCKHEALLETSQAYLKGHVMVPPHFPGGWQPCPSLRQGSRDRRRPRHTDAYKF